MTGRRTSHELHALYRKRQLRRVSNADGGGWIYAFIDLGNVWKMGMTNNFMRRRREWDRQCPSAHRIWMPPIKVQYRRRAETLGHLLLEMECTDRPGAFCPSCTYFLEPIYLLTSLLARWAQAPRKIHSQRKQLGVPAAFGALEHDASSFGLNSIGRPC
ncbi:uncharacterized protein C8R40DRAFT_124014 [Lentinula edodes]|uniref:uncharacterized protein n=1 Tax=Lentinula edodes TaxID=5353 RepID=UPI001E8EB208|nr:uncharacterized protein C8R40DRAFT_124014 [Lentinula edodes]KAH7876261.1 hypothetical protein C8R40DRAFT_124014 [Lentinula edodes]